MPEPDPLVAARRVAGQAQPGEQVEAYVAHARDTDVAVLRGDVESLTVAEQFGIGVRVLVDGRQGYASASVSSRASGSRVPAEA